MILNRQRTVRVARPPLELFLHRVREQLGLNGAEVTICLVSDAKIAHLNEAFRNKKGRTDVLSFPSLTRRKPQSIPRQRSASGRGFVATADRGGRFWRPIGKNRRVEEFASAEISRSLGDIAISPATARRNAKRYKRSLPSELRILILHGVLHLLGYDHETDRGQMTRIENKLRRKLDLQ
jgi:probable rRNA maturation factor